MCFYFFDIFFCVGVLDLDDFVVVCRCDLFFVFGKLVVC